MGNTRLPETMLVHCIKTVWNDTSSEPNIRRFRKYCVSIQTDVTEDNVLQDEGHEENFSPTDESVGSDYLTQRVLVTFWYNKQLIYQTLYFPTNAHKL